MRANLHWATGFMRITMGMENGKRSSVYALSFVVGALLSLFFLLYIACGVVLMVYDDDYDVVVVVVVVGGML